jgi:hypothetical protein
VEEGKITEEGKKKQQKLFATRIEFPDQTFHFFSSNLTASLH